MMVDRMKKRIRILTACMLVFLLLGGCGKKQNAKALEGRYALTGMENTSLAKEESMETLRFLSALGDTAELKLEKGGSGTLLISSIGGKTDSIPIQWDSKSVHGIYDTDWTAILEGEQLTLSSGDGRLLIFTRTP